MKTRTNLKNLMLLLCSTVLLCACSDDEEPHTQGECISVFLRTEQDQIGDFAYNAMTVFDGKVWSFGGLSSYAGDDATNQLWNSTNGQNWQSTGTTGLNAVGRRGHTLTTFQDGMILIGGRDNSGNLLSDIWMTADGINWHLETDSPPFGTVSGHAIVPVGNTALYLIAQNTAGTGTMVWHNDGGTTWTELTDNAFGALKTYHALNYGGELYVIGGAQAGGGRTNAIWKSADGIHWESIDVSGLPAIDGHSVAVYDNKAWVIAGSTNSEAYANDIYYSNSVQTWTRHIHTRPDSIDAVVGASILPFRDGLWIFGGNRGVPDGLSGKIWELRAGAQYCQ